MEFSLKALAKESLRKALSKGKRYRFLGEWGESESICRDILAVEPDHQGALLLLGLVITDQFKGDNSDRYGEAERIFNLLTDRYERIYYIGLLHERRAKAELRAGRPPRAVIPTFQKAMSCFEEAEKIRPPRNDDPILRWNRCVRILQGLEPGKREEEPESFDDSESPQIHLGGKR